MPEPRWTPTEGDVESEPTPTTLEDIVEQLSEFIGRLRSLGHDFLDVQRNIFNSIFSRLAEGPPPCEEVIGNCNANCFDQCVTDCIGQIPSGFVDPGVDVKTFCEEQICGNCCRASLSECQIRYLAHIAAAEASGTHNDLAISALVLSQLNAYKAGGRFENFRVIEEYLQTTNRQDLIDIYHQGNPNPEKIEWEDLITQSQAYDAYMTICNNGAIPKPTRLVNYDQAIAVVAEMSCVSPSGDFNYAAFDDSLGTLTSIVNEELRNEVSFCTSVLDKIEYGGWHSAFIPQWWPPDDSHVIIQGTPRSILIYTGSGAGIHRNWQCPQCPGDGQPTIWYRWGDDPQCVRCLGTPKFTLVEIEPGSYAEYYTGCEGEEEEFGIPQDACGEEKCICERDCGGN